MTQVLQARCPNCQQTLRLPSNWLNRTVRCTFCKATFQTKAREGDTPLPRTTPGLLPLPPKSARTPPPPPTKAPALAPPIPMPPRAAAPLPAQPVPAVAAPATGDAFSFAASTRGRLPRRRNRFLPALFLWLGVIVVAGVLGFLAWPEISGLFKGDKDSQPIAKVEDPNASPPAVVVPPTKQGETPEVTPPVKKGPDPVGKTPDETPTKVHPPVKKVEPKKVDPPKKKATPPVVVKGGGGEFPRRALLINASNYLLFNPLFYGIDMDGKKPGGSSGAVARRLTLPPMNFPPSQVYELADGKKSGAHGTSKSVIESAINEFAATSREQDRILLLFSGHGMEIEGEPYLVPIDGNRADAKSLVKLSWVFDRLKECPARQKILVLDVFRFPPARGEEIDGTGAMTEAFVTKLNTAPPGVQVWASCSKDQQSIELENGSLFLQAFNQATKDVKVGIAQPEESIPIEELLPLVNKSMKNRLATAKLEQVSLMIGKEETGKAYDRSEPLAAALTFKEAGGADPALRAEVQLILDEVNLLPSIRGGRAPIPASSMLPFVTKLKGYEADYSGIKEVEMLAKDAEKYPLRAAYFEAVEVLKECAKFPVKEYQPGPVTDALKKQIEALQKDVPGLLDFELKRVKAKLDELDETERDKETSKRWLANFDYVRAMVTAKIIFLNEYNYLLAGIRADRVPELEGAAGWRVGSSKRLGTSESQIKTLNRALPKMWNRIAKDYAGTPWAVLAQREGMTAIGLEWRAAKD